MRKTVIPPARVTLPSSQRYPSVEPRRGLLDNIISLINSKDVLEKMALSITKVKILTSTGFAIFYFKFWIDDFADRATSFFQDRYYNH